MASISSRRSFISRLWLFVCALPLTAYAQHVEPRRVRRVGFLIGDVPTLIKAFEEEIRRLGYVDGKDLIIEKRIDAPDGGKQVAELVRMDLDVIVAAALPHALEVRKNNPTMPVVIGTCPGMVSNGFAKSMKHPGGLYTGMDELPTGITAKRLRLLKSLAPNVSRVALLSTTPGRGGHEMQLADAERAARELRLTVKPYRPTSLKELEAALTAMVNDGMDGLLNFQGGASLFHRQLIVDFAAKHRLPAIYQSAFFVEAGGLMSWAPDQEEQFREAARYVDKILKGAKPGDLPVRHPSKYYLSINKSAAEGLGLRLPPRLLAKADKIVS